VPADKRVDFVPGSGVSGLTVPGMDLEAIMKAHAAEWAAFLSQWLGGLNCRNASLSWWSYRSTAKNLLSSPLGQRLFEVLAVREAVTRLAGRLEVCGATPGQMEAIAGLLRFNSIPVGGAAYRLRGVRRVWQRIEGLMRQAQQAMRVWLGFAFSSASNWRGVQLCLFTYADTARRPNIDGYFGALHDLAGKLRPELRIGHAAYVYAPYRSRLRELQQVDGARTFALFSLLQPLDLVRALAAAARALFPRPVLAGEAGTAFRALAPLLEEALVEDVKVGGYLHNLLVYRAVQRLVERSDVRMLVYPYENKSLEKALLLGARASRPALPIIGYQHTSITRRHLTLRFEPGEAAVTPLPDRIVTVGQVTRSYLERHGNYPAGIFVTGCALRQAWDAVLPRAPRPGKPPRVLLALSSSRAELVEAVAFVRSAAERHALEVGIRPHPNFPLTLLPADLRAWIGESATDFSGTPLAQNLEWCDAVAYVSSTVALEALMRGRPAVNLRLSDAIDPDPLLEPAALTWKVDSPEGLIAALAELRDLDGEAFAQRQSASIEKMKEYFRPISNEALAHFLPG
jgi:hypothetical protein